MAASSYLTNSEAQAGTKEMPLFLSKILFYDHHVHYSAKRHPSSLPQRSKNDFWRKSAGRQRSNRNQRCLLSALTMQPISDQTLYIEKGKILVTKRTARGVHITSHGSRWRRTLWRRGER